MEAKHVKYKNYYLKISFKFNFLKIVFILFEKQKQKQKSSFQSGPYSLYFICHYLFGGRYTKIYIYIYDIGFTEFKGGMRKINNSFKIPRNTPNIRISHSLKFSIKPNIRIFIFSGI